jgi:hypothetical protein
MYEATLILYLYDVSEVRTAFSFISLIMEAVRTYETSVYFNETTPCYILECSLLQRFTFLKSINQLIFVMVKCCAFFEVRTEFLNVI